MKLYQRLIKLLKTHKLMLIGLVLSGLVINLSGQDVIITSDDFSVDSTGKIFAKSGIVGGYSLTENSFYSEIYPLKDYTQDDVQKIIDYIMGEIEITDEEKILYDIDCNGKIDARDMYFAVHLANTNVTTTEHGTIHINNRDPINTIVLKDKDGEVTTRIGLLGIDTNRVRVDKLEADNVEDITDRFEFNGSTTGKVYKIGKVVFMQIYMLASETAGWGTVATIPSDLYPVEIFDGGAPISRNTVLGIWLWK